MDVFIFITFIIVLIQVVFDSLIFGQAFINTTARGGIYRYSSQLFFHLYKLSSDNANFLSISPFCPSLLYSSLSQLEIKRICSASHITSQVFPSNANQYKQPIFPASSLKYFKQFAKYPIDAYQLLSRLDSNKTLSCLRLSSLLIDKKNTSTVFHTPYISIPRAFMNHTSSNIVVTIYDMIPCLYPQFFTQKTVNTFRAMLENISKASQIICISESTRRDFLRFYPNHPLANIHVTPLAASKHLKPLSDSFLLNTFREELNISSTGMVISTVSTIEPRKNLLLLVQAFEKLCRLNFDSELHLVLAGASGWKNSDIYELISSSDFSDRIKILGHVSEFDLRILLSLSDVFVYPSFYEGFGLPPLEAMQCATPVVVAKTSSLPEVVGDAGIYFDPYSVQDLTNCLSSVLFSTTLQTSLKESGLDQSRKFCWSKTASQTLDIYRKASNYVK